MLVSSFNYDNKLTDKLPTHQPTNQPSAVYLNSGRLAKM